MWCKHFNWSSFLGLLNDDQILWKYYKLSLGGGVHWSLEWWCWASMFHFQKSSVAEHIHQTTLAWFWLLTWNISPKHVLYIYYNTLYLATVRSKANPEKNIYIEIPECHWKQHGLIMKDMQMAQYSHNTQIKTHHK